MLNMRPHCVCTNLIQSVCFLTFATILANCLEVLECYKCSVTVEKFFIDNVTIITPLCSKFEKSSHYMVKCPYSTMCLKTISTLHLQNGQKQETITRGCAQQKNTTQVFRNKQWEQEHLVQEVYKEGCTEIQVNNLAGSTNIHCYCRGELCNSSNISSFNKKLLSAIILLSTMALINTT
ncbi:uncharacterized protein LOC133836255 isoform X1 [Drosophila sulfurigaster albostrigata]|uniref:uncharacterized protein LOC133836255 isoform X1 n=1 Tax=Drosophila sulfurigaster albostrigata TaxID=89887 RepID=UPI002D2198A1|nr:uncharacterized protein LOC133836255 isoform X1 [Drosophila sulfurigaster albostrigata]